MKFVKWTLIFIFIFCLSLVLIKTLSLDTFKTYTTAWFFGYDVPELPVYYYVLGGFIIGLSIGIVTAVYYFVTFKTDGMKKAKRISHLEKEAETLNIKIASQKENINKLEQELVQEKSKALYKPDMSSHQAQPQQQTQPVQKPLVQQQPQANQNIQQNTKPQATDQSNQNTTPTAGQEFSLEDFLDN